MKNDESSQISNGGVSEAFARQRQGEEGYNELPLEKPKRIYSIVFSILKEPMVYILIGCGVIYFIIGDRQEALMLMGFLLLILGITVTQETKAERALEALRDLSSPRAMVLREGIKQRIPGREVVRDDIIFVNEGDRVSADALILSHDFIAADESLLTGESTPVDKKNGSIVFAGSTIVSGQGIAVVTAISTNTEMGKIGKTIQNAVASSTGLEKETAELVKKVAWVAGFLCILVVVIYALTRGSWLQGSLIGLSLAMAILPNELPAVLTIFLALGAWRISQRRVLTRKISAIENLGAASVLCVDKTGTLTLNKMTIHKIYSHGGFIELHDQTVNSLEERFHEVLEFGILACREDPFDPMEIAFRTAGTRYLQGTEHLHFDWTLKKEYPLSTELLSISHAWTQSSAGGFVIGAKGAPEAIIDLCHLSLEEAAAMSIIAEQMASEGYRVLGVAKAFSELSPLPVKQHDFDFTMVGLIGLMDPIRPEVPDAVSECHKAGIRVVMITGDHPATAKSIARKIGLINPDEVITGAQLLEMPESELLQMVKEINVFSRIMPEQKLSLVNSMKAGGEIVAMTGDGVNDAPALKSANIGIAMGGRGTDVARESAHLVLLDDDFSSIVEAIRMGRRIYANLRKALIYLFAIHIPIAGMSIFPVFFGLPLVFFPAHIAFLHLIIEPASSIAFEVEPAGSEIMLNPPRTIKEKLFDKSVWFPSLLMGTSILIALLGVYYISLSRGQGEADARTLVFTTLIISNSVLIYVSSGTRLKVRQKLKANKVVKYLIFISFLMLTGVLSLASLRDVFSFTILHPFDIGICLLVGILSVVWSSKLKLFK